MNDRNRALKLLREAKETLATRLTEKVLDQQEEILADARGDSYMNEIESLYEQVGIKLSHVNSMLSNLPVEPPATQVESTATQHSADDTFTVATDPSQYPTFDNTGASVTYEYLHGYRRLEAAGQKPRSRSLG